MHGIVKVLLLGLLFWSALQVLNETSTIRLFLLYRLENKEKALTHIQHTRAQPCPQLSSTTLAQHFHSTQGEDEFLMNYFNGLCHGTYIEMGALDGVRSSNTFAFNKLLEWKGVLIELNPTSYQKLAQNRPNEIATIHAAVCDSRKTVHWYKAKAGPLCGIWEFTSPHYRERWWVNASLKDTVPIECSPLQHLLDKHAPNHSFFDIFSLDVEGAEFQVLQSLDFEKVGFGMILVENDTHNMRKNLAVTTMLQSLGYNLLQRQGNNDVYVNKNFGIIYKDFLTMEGIQESKKDTTHEGQESNKRTVVSKPNSISNEFSPQNRQLFLFDPSMSSSLKGATMDSIGPQWSDATNYSDLLSLSSKWRIHPKEALCDQAPNNIASRTILLSHAVPKTGGTTVRSATFRQIRETCPSAGAAADQKGAFSHVDLMKALMKNCSSTDSYVLAGDKTFPALDDDSNIAIVHTVAFRNYKEWSKSALNQIIKRGGLNRCQAVRDALSKNCQPLEELNHNQYSKVQLERILKHSLSLKDIVIMYDYKDTTKFQTQIRSQLGLKQLLLKNHNEGRSSETCSPDVLEMFYKCHEI